MRIALIFIFLFFHYRGKAQDYKHVLLDGGMEVTQNFSRFAYSSDSCLVSISDVRNTQIALVKTGVDGKVRWQYKLPKSQGIGIYDVVVLENADVVFMYSLEAPTGAIRHWIHLLKLNKNGELIWDKMSESYQDFRPRAMEYIDGEILIAGEVVEFDSQVFFMRLDTSAELISYDCRKADYKEIIGSIGKYKDWYFLGGSHYFGGNSEPLIVAIDPGGNIRYFYFIGANSSSHIVRLISDNDSLYALTENSIITLSQPVARVANVFRATSTEVSFMDMTLTSDNSFLLSGAIFKTGRFTQEGGLMGFEKGFKTAWVRHITDYPRTHWFSFIKPLNNNKLIVGGNRHISHYYGATMSYTDSKMRSLCNGRDTTFEFIHEPASIFTYVPESNRIQPEFKQSWVQLESFSLKDSVLCSPGPPIASFRMSKDTICLGESVGITNNSLNETDNMWTAEGSQRDTFFKKNIPALLYSNPGVYEIKLKVWNSLGADSVSQQVVVLGEECEEYIYVPNAFTPDRNGRNDRLAVKHNLGVPINFRIYSRYGELVHEVTDINPDWDGKYLGAWCQEGVYMYLVEYADQNGKEHQKSGVVHLIITE